MKDKQTPTKPQPAQVPVISPLLHVFTMPVIVFLRRDFGYSFLRPKSIFFAIIWAFALYLIYAWYESFLWLRNFFPCVFGVAATLLYGFHLLMATLAQMMGGAQHDNFAGKLWLHSLVFQHFNKNERITALLIEPAFVAIAAYFSTWLPAAGILTTYLKYAALALLLKELINRWYEVRKVKLHRDVLDDAEDQIEKASKPKSESANSSAETTRKRRVKRKRIADVEPQEQPIDTPAPDGKDDEPES